jgi:hypothetical protein
VGGLAGTNIGAGDPNNADLEDLMGSSADDVDRRADEKEGPPFGGPAGGAVGGTPAEKRSAGRHTPHGITPVGIHRGDSTIGSDPSPGGKG